MPASCGSPPGKDTNPPSQGSGLSLWVPASRSPSRVRLPSQRACFPPGFLNLAKDIQHRRVNKAERRILKISKSGPKRNLGVGCREPNRQKMGNFKFGRKTLRRHSLRRFLLAFLALAAACSVVWAQATTSVRGTLLDPAGAAVPGVEITLQNTDTAAIRTTVSDAAGRYQFLQVPPGSYRIRAEMTGFDGVAPDNVQLLVNTPLTLDLRFQIRVIVNVPAPYVPPINRVDATIGSTILNTQIVALPLEGRNVAGLLSLQPGVVYTGIDDKTVPDTRGGAVAGARSDQTNITLDGVDVNDQLTGEAFKSVLPVTLDSVREFRVITANATADEGRSSGGKGVLGA